jgi:hypothetical protein
MLKFRRLSAVAGVVTFAWVLGAPAAAFAQAALAAPSDAVLSKAWRDLPRLEEMIRPTPQESHWSRIPWMIDMKAAREKAAAAGKPLVVWTMAGEPLGHC